MMEIHESQNSLAKGTVLAFEFPSASDVVKICRRNQDSGEMELLQESKCTFHDCDSTVVMELTYIADADGQPDIHIRPFYGRENGRGKTKHNRKVLL